MSTREFIDGIRQRRVQSAFKEVSPRLQHFFRVACAFLREQIHISFSRNIEGMAAIAHDRRADLPQSHVTERAGEQRYFFSCGVVHLYHLLLLCYIPRTSPACHSERSEEFAFVPREILRCAQNDSQRDS